MVTDDERREVAERLRGMHDYETAVPIIRACLGLKRGELMDDETRRRMSDRLADLIDPGDTCEHWRGGECFALGPCDTSQTCRDTVACDREALLAEAKEAEKSARYFALDHDEDELRDRLTEAAEEFSDVARRIREACGEAVG